MPTQPEDERPNNRHGIPSDVYRRALDAAISRMLAGRRSTPAALARYEVQARLVLDAALPILGPAFQRDLCPIHGRRAGRVNITHADCTCPGMMT